MTVYLAQGECATVCHVWCMCMCVCVWLREREGGGGGYDMQLNLCWYRRCIFLTAFFTCFSVLPLYFTWIVIYNKLCLFLHNDIQALIHACMCVWVGGVLRLCGSGPLCMFLFVICVIARFSSPLRTKIKSWVWGGSQSESELGRGGWRGGEESMWVCIWTKWESLADLAAIIVKNLPVLHAPSLKRRKDNSSRSSRSRHLCWTMVLPSWQAGLEKIPWVFCPWSDGYNLC